jgi:hypothetical protein
MADKGPRKGEPSDADRGVWMSGITTMIERALEDGLSLADAKRATADGLAYAYGLNIRKAAS